MCFVSRADSAHLCDLITLLADMESDSCSEVNRLSVLARQTGCTPEQELRLRLYKKKFAAIFSCRLRLAGAIQDVLDFSTTEIAQDAAPVQDAAAQCAQNIDNDASTPPMSQYVHGNSGY